MNNGGVESPVLQTDAKFYGTCVDKTNEKGSDILERTIGDFGKWQCKIVLLMSMLKMPIAWVQLGVVFIARPTDFWCKASEEFANLSQNEWKSMITINENDYPSIPEALRSCYMKNINQNSTNSIIPCEWGYEYNRSEIFSSMIMDWDLVCDRDIWVEVLQMSVMLAILLGMSIFGPAADKYGRKNVLMISIWLQTLCGFASTISPWFSGFFLFRFLSSLTSSGLMIISFVICIEVSTSAWRSAIIILHLIPFGLGFSFMGLLAYFITEWRILLVVQYVCCLLFFSYYWLIPESPRWLLAVDRKEEAIKILEDAAETNGMEASEIRKEINNYRYLNLEKHMILTALKNYPKFRGRTLFLSLNWLLIGCLYFGLYQLSGSMTENIYASVCIAGLITIPSNLAAVSIVKKCGRKLTIAFSTLFTGLSLFALLAIPNDNYFWIKICVFGCAMFGLIILYAVVHLFTGELFPTTLRNSAAGMTMMFAKVGGMISPFIIGLEDVSRYIPFVIFGIVAIIIPFFLIPLPETKDKELPELVNDVEHSHR